jgi:cell division protein FtsI (penicillin-binding protein 3)
VNRRRAKTKPAMPAWRPRLLIGLFAVVAVTLEARLVWLQLFQSDFLSAEGDERQLRVVEMPAYRGLLLDRRGEALAVSTPVDSLFVNPQKIPVDRIAELAKAVGRDGAELEREISSRSDKEFYWVARRLAPADAEAVLELGIPGVSTRREYKRFYPTHEVTCHLVGFTGDEDIGQEGLEYAFDARLAAEPGSKRVQRDERGRIIADVEEIKAPRPGRDIRTSIDMRLQWPAYRALKAAVMASGASSGSLVVLDIETGEVLAMVNQPACNPNDLEQRANPARFRNRAITDPIEPGSSIKPLILAAALANGYTPETMVDVPRDLYVAGQYVTHDEGGPLGVVSVTEILARSSSVGMAKIGLELDPAEIWRTLKAFGIGEWTGNGDPADNGERSGNVLGRLESPGKLEDYAQWGKVGQATLSYGYRLSVTPLQLARAYAAIGSGGLLPPVSFEALTEPPDRVRAISPEIAADLMKMLEAVVYAERATATRAEIPNYRVAGKTGTARMFVSGEYSDDKYRAIFAGLAPASSPRFVAVVVISDPRSQAYHGGDIAAPVFAKVMASALQLYGVAPDGDAEPLLISRAEEWR